jgi:Zn-dependent peptidase ImmA (M78 family)
MSIDDVGANPEKLAQAIHQKLNLTTGPVPVREIALALDIEEITEAPLTSFEGALLTTPERTTGKILLNTSSPPERRRFTLSHELGHYLNMTHQGESDGGFQCSKTDMVTPRGHERHVRQEAEANRFAIELLAPAHLIRPYLISRFYSPEPVISGDFSAA